MTNEYDLCYSYDDEGQTPSDTQDIYDEQDEQSKFIIDNFGWECDITPQAATFAVHMANYKSTSNQWYDLIRLYQTQPSIDYEACPSSLETDEDAEYHRFLALRYLHEYPQYD